jgi:hypothetical protein
MSDTDRAANVTEPISARLEATSKPLIRSKTFWLQVLTLLAVFLPGVQDWLARNPVEPVAVLVAVNIIIRFATSGRVTIFREDDGKDGEKSDGPAGGLGLFAFGTAAVLMGGLPSCSAPLPITGTVSYLNPRTGAKAGLVFDPGAPARARIAVPLLDADTGDRIGFAELETAHQQIAE